MVKAVVASLPAELVALLPYRSLPKRNRRQFLEGMGTRTVEQIIARAARRWVAHGYADALHSADGRGIGSAVGVAVALVQEGECPSPRCEDGQDLDTGAECRICVERRAERRSARKAAAAAGRHTGTVRTLPGRPGWWECTICKHPGNGPVPEGGECAGCQKEAAAAARQLSDQWKQEDTARKADWQAAAEFCAAQDRQAEETAAQEAAEAQRAAQERTEQQQAEAEETARIRAQLAAEYPELAAVSGSQSAGPAPF